ncbi:MAG: nuclear transport factor 2 family protein, partial [Gammaproteobacteria bacterium]
MFHVEPIDYAHSVRSGTAPLQQQNSVAPPIDRFVAKALQTLAVGSAHAPMATHSSTHDQDAVLAANAAFYRAFESLNLTRMEAVWLHAAHVKCVHPGWGLLVGWGPVMESWQRIFANTVALQFSLTALRVEIIGDLAWVV